MLFIKKLKHNKKGYLSIEAILAITAILSTLILFIYMFIQTVTNMRISNTFHTFVQQIKIDGNVSAQNEKFIISELKRNKIPENSFKIRVIELETNKNLINTNYYSKKDNGYIIKAELFYSKPKIISLFSIKNKINKIEEHIISEKW